jgi:hypothetical protein
MEIFVKGQLVLLTTRCLAKERQIYTLEDWTLKSGIYAYMTPISGSNDKTLRKILRFS